MFKFNEIKENNQYNALSSLVKMPFTQAWFFGEWQEAIGRKVRRFEIIKDAEVIGFFQIIKYPLIFSKNFIYIPHGPILMKEPNSEFSKKFSEKLFEIGREENAVFIRFDPLPWFENNFNGYFEKVPEYAHHSSYFQPKYEWTINLTKTEEELLIKMHPKTRYSIGLAERRGIKIEIINTDFEKYFDDFYKLLKETARRNNFNLHPELYYKNIFKILNLNNAFLTIANYEYKILLVNLISLYGETAYFMYGGSSDEHKNLMFSYLAQWKGITEAKKRGFKTYNFGAVGDNFEGISRFKKGFGGKLLEYSDSYDLVLKLFWYNLYNFYKRIQ